MSSIRLSTKHGLAPALTFCPLCGKDTNELALLGASCDKVMREVHEMTGGKAGSIDGYKEYGHNRIPSSEPCDECKAKQATCNDEVKRGGIYWKCRKCGSEGAIKAEHPLAKQVREQMKIEAPAPCGIDLTGQCPLCDK
jgi:ribosomal protein L37AE/L43A